jgi:predicted transcriptional regulator
MLQRRAPSPVGEFAEVAGAAQISAWSSAVLRWRLGELKLFGMRAAYDEIVASAGKREHEPQRVVSDLLTAELLREAGPLDQVPDRHRPAADGQGDRRGEGSRNLASAGECASLCTRQYNGLPMTATTTMTIRVSSETKRKLERLAADTRRSKSFLAAEAVSAYVERELEIIDGIRRGMADVEAGHVVAHDKAMMEVQTAIEAAKSGKA